MCASYDITNPICCKCSPTSTLTNLVCDQRLRDMRHHDLCRSIKGCIGDCNTCNRKDVSTNDIIHLRLDNIRRSLPPSSSYANHDLTAVSEQKLAIYTMTSLSENLFEDEYQLLFDISRYLYNEHNYKHRPTCFKKGVECRFHYPAGFNQTWDIDLGHSDVTEHANESKPWATLDGMRLARGFCILPKRDVSDLFLNVHSTSILRWNGYNNNIQLGDPAHIFYNTLYTSKSAVDEDSKVHQNTLLFVKTKIEKDLNQHYQLHPEEASHNIVFNDFKNGLIRLLRGITGHLCESVISSNLAAHIISTGTRFHFSHDFCHIMIRQFEEYFAGNSVQYTMRWSRDEGRGYIDSNVFDYVFRPPGLENMCLYEFLSLYESVSRHTVSTQRVDIHEFEPSHPSKDFKVLRQLSCACIPIIEGENFCDMQLLLSDNHDNEERNRYARRALILFHPFRNLNDLYSTSEDSTISPWNMFMNIRQDQNSVFWKIGNCILQNHQDRIYNIQRMGRITDKIERSTHISSIYSDNNAHVEEGATDLMGDGVFFSSDDADALIWNISPHTEAGNDLCSIRDGERNILAYEIPYTSRNLQIPVDSIVSANAQSTHEPYTRLQQGSYCQDNVIRIAIGSFLQCPPSLQNNQVASENGTPQTTMINMHDVALKFQLDHKQRKAFFVQSSSFLYQVIKEQDSPRYEYIFSTIRSANQEIPPNITDSASLLAHLQSVSCYYLTFAEVQAI